MNKLSLGEKAAPSQLNRWVDPAFADFKGEGYSPLGKKKTSQDCFKATPKRPRKGKGEVATSDSHRSYLLRESAESDHDKPWVDRYSPRSQAELAVHKKKIEEVDNWLRVHINKPQGGGILLLTGPSGCGKTATIRVLSLELGFRIQEWTNPTNMEPYNSSQYATGGWSMNGLSYSSQLVQFQDFLLRANKYNCLKMLGDGGATDKKLILVEDFPNQFYRQPGSLHEILRCFVKTSRCPLVFIVSDSLSGDSSSRSLFPKDIQEELDISSISFNPVAPTTMMKVLTRISTSESGGNMHVPDQTVLEKLCSGSSGDVRSAVNSLQFSSLPDTSLEKVLLKMKKDKHVTSLGKVASRRNQRTKSKQTMEQEDEQAVGGKDTSLFLFRALGKILHCKRRNHGASKAAHCSSEHSLPSHLSFQHRDVLQVNPELVVERSHMSGEFFNLYLHQNYLDFFTEVEDVDQASGYLSDADLLTADWTSRSTLGEYGTSVATRGLLHSNSRQASVGFRPLHKPSWLLVNKNYQDNCLSAQSLFRSFCLTPVSLQTELLPFLAKINNPMRNQAQISFIQDVGQMSLRRFVCRLRLEALTDKEPGQLEMDIEEEEEEKKVEGQAGVEEDLPASQPQPITILLEKDLIIEEYTSD